MFLTAQQLTRFDRKRRIGVPDECWLWLGGKNAGGYGQCRILGKTQKSHRVAWAIAHGEWPPSGLVVRHRCDTPACCNPSHLELGTHADNSQDRSARHRYANTKGAAHPRVKLTESQVLSIRADRRPGPVVASEYGLNRSTINRIRRRANWAHLPEILGEAWCAP
jgi:hypothetical protein